MSRATRIISTALITAGLVVFADVAATLAWKEPLSTLVASFDQREARDRAAELAERFRRDDPPPPRDRQARMSEREVVELAARKARRFRSEYMRYGEAIGEISIPALGSRFAVLEGTDSSTLQRGPGHYPDTELPGEGKTAAIAGHRTTYGAPFRYIDQLKPGDEITLEMPYGHFTYEVTEQRIVWPSEYTVTQDLRYERLVLSACHPLYSAAQRLIVFGRLKEIDLWPEQGKAKGKGKGRRRDDLRAPAAPLLALAGSALVLAAAAAALRWRARRRGAGGG